MGKLYEILRMGCLKIRLDDEFAKELRGRSLGSKDWTELRKSSSEVVNGGRVDFVGGSYLLHSVGFDGNSSCTLYMDRGHHEFFCEGDLKKKLPSAFGSNEKVLYATHNADMKYHNDVLVKSWKNWFDYVGKLF